MSYIIKVIACSVQHQKHPKYPVPNAVHLLLIIIDNSVIFLFIFSFFFANECKGLKETQIRCYALKMTQIGPELFRTDIKR